MIRSLVFVVSACCCSLLLLSSCLADAAVTCPPIELYSPCDCTEWTGTGTIRLSCFARNLTDSKAAEILQVFLTTPGVSPVGILKLDRNLLTRIPDEIHQFPQLVRVQLDSNNITSVDTAGAFKFTGTAPLQLLMLYNTQLTTIAPGAFQGNGYGDGGWIDLPANNLTRFEATVFKTVLEQMEPSGGYPVDGSYVWIENNPFDCSDCHLSWLIRDNRQLLTTVYRGTCSNGTKFEDLDPNGFASCPLFLCPLSYDGYYADPLSCTSYYNCRGDIAYLYECPSDLVFNPTSNRCEALANVPQCHNNNLS